MSQTIPLEPSAADRVRLKRVLLTQVDEFFSDFKRQVLCAAAHKTIERTGASEADMDWRDVLQAFHDLAPRAEARLYDQLLIRSA